MLIRNLSNNDHMKSANIITTKNKGVDAAMSVPQKITPCFGGL